MAGALFGDSFPPGGTADLTGGSDSAEYAMGMHFRPVAAVTVTAVRWFVPTANAPSNANFAAGLVRVDPVTGVTIGGTITWLNWSTGVTRPGAGAQGTWVSLPLSAPVAVSAGDELYAVVRTNRYPFVPLAFEPAIGVGVPGVDPRLVYDRTSTPFPCGAFVTGGDQATNPPAVPSSSFNSTFYGVDVELAGAGGQTFTTGLPTEADSALPAGRRKTRTTGLPAELDAALTTAARRKRRTTGLPAELDTALGVAQLVIPGRPVAGDRLRGTPVAATRPSTVEASDR